MTQVYIGSDLHLGHKNICKFRSTENGFFRSFADEAEHRAWIKEEWHKKVTKRDKVFLLGDIAFYKEALDDFATWTGTKVLILGNHDTQGMHISDLCKVYSEIHSLYKYKGLWLSHCPMHIDELRGRKNLHGHCHNHIIQDDRYFNCCVENVGVLITLEEINERMRRD